MNRRAWMALGMVVGLASLARADHFAEALRGGRVIEDAARGLSRAQDRARIDRILRTFGFALPETGRQRYRSFFLQGSGMSPVMLRYTHGAAAGGRLELIRQLPDGGIVDETLAEFSSEDEVIRHLPEIEAVVRRIEAMHKPSEGGITAG